MMNRFILRAQTRAVLPQGVVLHASAVAEDNASHLFLAPSGGGKSTLMNKLSRSMFGAIADDSAVVARGTDGVIRCLPCGSMKQGTGVEDIHGAPLYGIYFIEKGTPSLVLRIEPEYAFYRAVSTSPIMAWPHLEQQEQKQTLRFLESLMHLFPVYILRYDISQDPENLIRTP